MVVVLEVLEGLGHHVGVNLVLVVLAVHPDVVRIGEVGVVDLLALEDEVLELVVSAEDGLGRGVRQKILHLHLDGGGAAAALGVLGLDNNHRILADHEDIADAQFLCGFHLEKVPLMQSLRASPRRFLRAIAQGRKTCKRAIVSNPHAARLARALVQSGRCGKTRIIPLFRAVRTHPRRRRGAQRAAPQRPLRARRRMFAPRSPFASNPSRQARKPRASSGARTRRFANAFASSAPSSQSSLART